jgi:glutathione S-transferase
MAKAKKKAKAKPKPRKPKKLVASAKIKAAAKKSAARAAKGAPIGKTKAAKSGGRKRGADGFVLHAFHLSMPSSKVGLMLSMSGVPWDYRHIDLPSGAHKRPAFLALNRFGQVPVLQHGKQFICQSNVILAYLAEQTGRFGPRNESDRLRIAEWLAWDFTEMADVRNARAFTRFYPKHEEVLKHVRDRGETALKTLDRHLGGSKFLVGTQPTIADIAVFPFIATAEEGGFVVANHPNLHAWALRMMALPGCGHPYTIMPKEDRVAA